MNESTKRALVKTLSYRLICLIAIFLLTFDFTISLAWTGISFILYYAHELYWDWYDRRWRF